MKNLIIFDLLGTLATMRPPTLLVRKDLLVNLADNYQLAIITGARKTETENVLDKLGIEKIFGCILTANDYPYKKPDARLFDILAKNLKFDKAVYLGDTKKDFQFAVNAKIPFFYIGVQKIGLKQDKDINELLKYVDKFFAGKEVIRQPFPYSYEN